jgi:DNA-directed RNA polymerase specialized sigma subunit
MAAPKRLTDAQRDLAAQWWPYALKWVSDAIARQPALIPHRDHLEALAADRLLSCARSWDESKGVPFPGYLKGQLAFLVTDFLRKSDKGRRRIRKIHECELTPEAAALTADPKPPSVGWIDFRDEIHHCRPIAGDKEWAAAWLTVVEGHTDKEAGPIMGCSPSWVHHLRSRAVDRLRPWVDHWLAG